ncbi:MAG: hypothetical protein R3A47_02880 [Polyangiales bacterium]
MPTIPFDALLDLFERLDSVHTPTYIAFGVQIEAPGVISMRLRWKRALDAANGHVTIKPRILSHESVRSDVGNAEAVRSL